MPSTGVELAVTYKCNWHCEYCLVDTHNQPDRHFSQVLCDIVKLDDGTEVTLSGGEVGLLSRRALNAIVVALKGKSCPIDLLTNGLMFKKHRGLLRCFEEIWYHCVEHLADDAEIEYPHEDQSKVLYIVVATDKELESGSLLKFINKYPHIKFLVLPDNRGQHRVNLNLFMAFFKEHKDKLHERTLPEFIVDLGRTWGEVRGCTG